jgi:hypothetical protein
MWFKTKTKIAYIKDEGANLNTMIDALKLITNYETLGVIKSFKGTCFGHAFSKASQHSTSNEKVCKGLSMFP